MGSAKRVKRWAVPRGLKMGSVKRIKDGESAHPLSLLVDFFLLFFLNPNHPLAFLLSACMWIKSQEVQLYLPIEHCTLSGWDSHSYPNSRHGNNLTIYMRMPLIVMVNTMRVESMACIHSANMKEVLKNKKQKI